MKHLLGITGLSGLIIVLSFFWPQKVANSQSDTVRKDPLKTDFMILANQNGIIADRISYKVDRIKKKSSRK